MRSLQVMWAAFWLSILAVVPLVAAAQDRALGPDVRLHSSFPTKFLSKSRDIVVWLPPGYESDRERRYPVFYLHDGANVYVEWRIDEIARPLIASKQIEPLIIVLVPNGGEPKDRFEDYTWTRPANARFGGNADAYGRMLVEELKPFIDKEYRTLRDAPNTAIGGASLGGLVSLYFALKYPEIFGKLAVMSPAVWWDDKLIVREVKRIKARSPSKIWLDVGAAETASMVRDAKDLRDALVRKGWTLGSDLVYFELPGGQHDEKWFAMRAGDLLKYLFPSADPTGTGRVDRKR